VSPPQPPAAALPETLRTPPAPGPRGPYSAAGEAAPRRRRWPRRLARLAGLVAGLAFAAFLAGVWVDAHGVAFYDAGRGAVATLDRLADALAAGDLTGVERAYAAGFAGRELGLDRRTLLSDRDGIEIQRLGALAPAAVDRDRAVAAWGAYLAGFASLDEVRLHLDRVEEWSADGPLTASVRFELMGTPRGAAAVSSAGDAPTAPPRSVVDRAVLRVRFERTVPDAAADAPTAASPDAAPVFAVAAVDLLQGERQSAAQPHFTDVAPAAGVDLMNRYYPAFLSTPMRFAMLRFGPAGITAADYDGDGLYDLLIPDGVDSRLYRNVGDAAAPRFEDVTEAAGLAGLSGVSVALFADYDDDGDRDLFVSRTFEPNQLFENRGDGTFEDVTADSGLGADCCTTVASWADYDLDGDLDLYVGRYLDPRRAIPPTFYARNGEPNRLYRNDGHRNDGRSAAGRTRFTDVTDQAGVGETGLCLGSAFGDYDDDGDPDLYVANDFGRKTLYRNQGDGTFRDVTVETGTLAYGAGMSSSFGDYDNDGRLDLYVAHIRSDHAWFAEAPTVWRYMFNAFRQGVGWRDLPLYFEIMRQSGSGFVDVFQQMASGNTLLRNRGDGTFEDVTEAASANPPGWFWGSGFYDLDNDGWQDLYSANGWVYDEPDTELELDFFASVVSEQRRYKTGELFDPAHFGGRSWHGWERNRHLRNRGDGTFEEIGHAAGSDLLRNSRGVAAADFWNRGVLDLAVAASTGRAALLRNELAGRHHFLAVELQGAGRALPDGTNRDAVGARVTLTAGGMTQIREVTLGDGYGSQNALRLHFGLGEAARVDELVVRWPRSRRQERFRNLAADRILRLREGSGELVELGEVAPTAATAAAGG